MIGILDKVSNENLTLVTFDQRRQLLTGQILPHPTGARSNTLHPREIAARLQSGVKCRTLREQLVLEVCYIWREGGGGVLRRSLGDVCVNNGLRIERTFDSQSGLLEHERVDLGGGHVFVPEQFLHRANVGPLF